MPDFTARGLRWSRLAIRLVVGSLLVLWLALTTTSSAFAQSSDTVDGSDFLSGQANLTYTAVIQADGTILVNGQRSREAKLEHLPDKYVFRYKLLDQPGEALATAQLTVQLPPTVTANQVRAAVYAVHGVDQSEAEPVNESTIAFMATQIGPDATITATIDLPKSAITLPPTQQFIASLESLTIMQLLAVSIAIPALMLGYALLLYLRHAQDLRLRPSDEEQPVPPSQLSPALVGILLNGYVGPREIAATLIDLAQRGYIDIIYRGEDDFAFSQKRRWQDDRSIQPFEKFFLAQLFDQPVVSDLKTISMNLNRHVWSQAVSQGIESMYQQMTDLGYFKANPRQSHSVLRFVGILIFFLSAAGLGLSLWLFSESPFIAIPWLVSLVASPILMRLALLVPRRTEAGRVQASRWLAFRQYLTEPTAIEMTNDPMSLYEKYLAYTIVFQAEGQWTARFSQLACRLPDWFFSQGILIDSYVQLASTLFTVIGFIGQKFSYSRNPNAV